MATYSTFTEGDIPERWAIAAGPVTGVHSESNTELGQLRCRPLYFDPGRTMESDKERHARVWGSAPFERAAATIADMHDALVASLEPKPGVRWLDLACGTAGDVAFRAAEAGAVVTGSDLAPY